MNRSQHPNAVIVPVRLSTSGAATLMVCRRPDGVRTGLAFGSVPALEHALGAGQQRLVLSLAALHGMLAEIDVHAVQVDPEAVVRAPSSCRAAS